LIIEFVIRFAPANSGFLRLRESPTEGLDMLKQVVLFGLLVVVAILAFSPVVESGNEIHVLFDFDLLLLLFTGESDPTVLSARYLDWYPNIGVLRIIVSVVLACMAVYMVSKVEDPDPVLGATEAGRRAKRFVEGGTLEVVDDPADGAAPAAESETEPVLLLPDRSRSPLCYPRPQREESS
jgi:hypothetical protein